MGLWNGFRLLTTILVAAAGGFVATKCKVPAAMLVGSLVAVSAFSVLTGNAYLPGGFKVFIQIVAGMFIGKRIRREDILMLRTMLWPAVVTVTGVLAFSMAMGLLLWRFTHYDIVTALFSCAPGGTLDMTLAASDMGGDPSIVSLLQLARYFSVIGVIPILVSRLPEKMKKTDTETPADNSTPPPTTGTWKYLGFTFLWAAIAGLIGWKSPVPAGTLLFAMVGAAGYNIVTGHAHMPITIKKVAQTLAGALIGSGLTMAALSQMRGLILPLVGIVLGFFVMNLLLAKLLQKLSGMDWITAFFSCCPGGLSDVVLIADDFGADIPRLTVIQTLRCVCLLGTYPSIIYLVAGQFG